MTTRVLGHAPDHITWAQIWPFNLQFSEYEWEPMNHARFLADDLVARVERIGTFTDNSIKERALWWGYTFGGVYRAMMASMYGLTKDGTKPGGVITTIEQVAAGEFAKENMKKPVIGYIAGLTAPKGRVMGHAGAIVSAYGESAIEKVEILKECGVTISKNPSVMGDTVKSVLEKI